jgi:hypothetical protein
MSAHENFEATTEFTGSFAAALLAQPIKFKEISCPGESKSLPDGSRVVTNDIGEVVYMDYASGLQVKRFRNYVICTCAQKEHWFRAGSMSWFRLD